MQESAKEWKNLTFFLNNGTCGNPMVKPQTVGYRFIKQTSKFWKYSRILKISLDSILNCLTRYKCIVIQKDSWVNIHEWFGCNFPTWNIRNVWRARDDGHHYDVTSKCCGVTITTRLIEWVRCLSPRFVYSFAVFKNCQALKNTNGYPNKVWDKSKTTWAVGIAQLTHHEVQGVGKNPETEGEYLWYILYIQHCRVYIYDIYCIYNIVVCIFMIYTIYTT